MANEFVARKGLISLADSQITGSLGIVGIASASGFSGSGHGLIMNLDWLTNVDTSGVQHQYGVIWNTGSSKWEAADVGASGTVSDAQNQGTGVGVYKTKIGGTLQFRSLISSSAVLNWTEGTDDITIGFDGTKITSLGTVTVGDVSGILPGGTVSSSGQVDGASIANNSVSFGGVSVSLNGSDTTPAFDLQDATNYPYAQLTSIPGGIVSSSAQVAILLPEGTVSGSGQVSYTGLANIPGGIVSSSAQVATLLPEGTVSSSGQVDGASIANNSVNFGGVTVSLNGSDTTPAFNLQDATAYPGDSSLVTLGTVVSGNVNAILPIGTVSSSGQISYTGLTNIPAGIISSSTQQVVSTYTNGTDNRVVTSTGAAGINAEANLTFDGTDLGVTGNIDVSGQGTFNEVWTNFITSSVGYLSGSTRFGDHPAASITHQFTGSVSITGSVPTVNGTAVSLNGHTHAYTSLTSIPGGIVSSSTQVATLLPEGTVSASSQVVGSSITTNTVSYGGISLALGSTDATPAFNLSDATAYPYTSLTGIPGGIISSSAQVKTALPEGTVSSSGQVDGASITNNSVNFGGVSVSLNGSDTTPAFDLQDASNYPYASLTSIPVGIVSSSTQVATLLPTGTISSSLQFNSLVAPFTGSFTGSFTGDGSNLTGVAGEVGFLQTTGSNLDIDTGTEVVATVATASYDAAWFDYVVKKSGGAHLRAGTVTAVWDAAEAANGVQFTDVSTLDIGWTGGVVFTMDLLGADARLKATVDSDNWIVKAIVRAI